MTKYRAILTEGFHSKKEANRFHELELLQKAGEIRQLVTQKRFPLEVNGKLICHYICDFEYFDRGKKEWVREDTKGFRTREFIIKKKLMAAIHNIEILET